MATDAQQRMTRPSEKVGLEIIPGYTLRKRIGAGGYGEVWLADAPGGLQKAVKLVFGSVEESHASAELKSLQRIKEVSHPFLLSLERIEIINNQVIIVTELAEGSLLDRLQQYRRQGEPGIPRATLLDFMRDTSDGLDFLAQKHSLQHLDVKPGNLLLVADRVKVADFGLVKDLHNCSQSMVKGLTPTYSAPEIFDGRPDHRSDQYSLAIVYMELLTGCLPFSGSSTAELARKHLTAEPELDALPPADRPIIKRALSKNPLDRYSSCRQLIEMLQKARASTLPVAPTSNDQADGEQPAESTDQVAATQSYTSDSGNLRFAPAMRVEQVGDSYCMPRSLFLALGGMGCDALAHLRQLVFNNYDSRLAVEDHGWLGVDTASENLAQLVNPNSNARLSNSQVVQIPIYKPIDYRESSPELLQPISRRWLYNIPKSQTTEGVRPIALLALLDHYEALKAKLHEELSELIREHEQDQACEHPLRIYLLASLHGGTGSGMLSEFGLLIRRVMSELKYNNYRICANLLWATTLKSPTACMPSANAIATFAELKHLMDSSRENPNLYYKDAPATNNRPFDWVTLLDGGLHGDAKSVDPAVQSLANAVFVDSQTALSLALAEERVARGQQGEGWIRSASASPLQLFEPTDQESVTKLAVANAVFEAHEYLKSTGSKESSTEETDETKRALHSESREASNQEMVKRTLHRMSFVESAGLTRIGNATEDQRDAFKSVWMARLSSDSNVVGKQMYRDIELWRNNFQNAVQMKVFGWRQIERIQLRMIESILDYTHSHGQALLEAVSPADCGNTEECLARMESYLKQLIAELMGFLRKFQAGGKTLRAKIESWAISLQAESRLSRDRLREKIFELPTEIQQLLRRISSDLEQIVHREALAVVPGTAGSKRILESDNNLLSLFKCAKVACEQHVASHQIDFSRYGEQEDSRQDCSLSLDQMTEFAPQVSRYGCQMYRFALAPKEHRDLLQQLLRRQGLEETTCVMNAPASFGAFVSCDGVQTGFVQALTSQCRPTTQTLQLAERLHTRVDIDWEPVSSLFEVDFAMEQEVAADMNGGAPSESHGTQAIPTSNLPLPSAGLPPSPIG